MVTSPSQNEGSINYKCQSLMDAHPTPSVNTSPIKLQATLNLNKSKNEIVLHKLIYKVIKNYSLFIGTTKLHLDWEGIE